MPLQTFFQALVHAVEALVHPVLVPDVSFLSAVPGAVVRTALGTVASSFGSSPMPSGSLVVTPAFSSHAGLLYGRLPASPTVPGRGAA